MASTSTKRRLRRESAAERQAASFQAPVPREYLETAKFQREAGIQIITGKSDRDPWDGARGYHNPKLVVRAETHTLTGGGLTVAVTTVSMVPKGSKPFVPRAKLRKG